MFDFLSYKRRWYTKTLRVDADSRYHYLSELLLNVWQSTPDKSELTSDLEFLVVDLEMSSLYPVSGEIISAGWVGINNQTIDLSSAQHHLVSIEGSVGNSATIHTIRDCELEGASPPEIMLHRLLIAAQGRVLVFHNADLDIRFLNKLSRSLLGVPLLLRVIDTLFIEKRRLDKRAIPIQRGDLKLDTCHQRHGLPNYVAHNALEDALATAQLLLAQISSLGPKANLSDLMAS